MPLLTIRGLGYTCGQLGSGPKCAGGPHLGVEGRNPMWSSKRVKFSSCDCYLEKVSNIESYPKEVTAVCPPAAPSGSIRIVRASSRLALGCVSGRTLLQSFLQM